MNELKNEKTTSLEPQNYENLSPKSISSVTRDNKQRSRNKDNMRKSREQQSEFSEKLIKLSRINKVTTGGRRLRFKAVVICGNRKGTVGIGISKASDVTEAIRKASADARKNIISVAITPNSSIYHEAIGKEGASIVLLKPAKKGIGLKAGGAVREVLKAVGIDHAYTKSLGSNNVINTATATIKALEKITSTVSSSKKTAAIIDSKEEKKVGN